MQYSPTQYIAIQNSLYVAFGPPNIGALIEFAAPLAAIGLYPCPQASSGISTNTSGDRFMLGISSDFLCFYRTRNIVIRSATAESIPANGNNSATSEYSHLARFFCHLAAFSALVLSV